MFEIRIIRDPVDAHRVTTALSTAFTTGAVRRHRTRDGERIRLHVTADHRPAGQSWATPEQAYAAAPSISDELGWTAGTSANAPIAQGLDREYFLRKAALLYRTALAERPAPTTSPAPRPKPARRLMDLDDASVVYDPRAYQGTGDIQHDP
ncbi:hypothetical protein [Streptomyces sp. NPDC052107]|uniref:hypothetical protein n=1 Tax=Streptomyces sp. NPDC052107 TaxID=3155632 RepID=UPI0034238788